MTTATNLRDPVAFADVQKSWPGGSDSLSETKRMLYRVTDKISALLPDPVDIGLYVPDTNRRRICGIIIFDGKNASIVETSVTSNLIIIGTRNVFLAHERGAEFAWNAILDAFEVTLATMVASPET